MDARRIDEIRRANFPAARRGYDRDAVDDFLDRLASSLEADNEPAAPVEPQGAVKREIALLGERTSGIISAAEEAAGKVREEADKRGVEAKEAAEELTRRARIEATEKSQKLVAEAENKAEQIIDEAVARRRRLNQAITSLAERRDEIATETTRLASELTAAVGRLTDFDKAKPQAAGATAAADSPASEEPPRPPEAQAAVPDRPQPGTGPAKATEPDHEAPPEPAEEVEEVEEVPEVVEAEDEEFEDDGGEFAAESDVYAVLEDDDEDLPRGPSGSRMLVDPEEDETALISPATPVPPSGSPGGPDPTEESALPLAGGDDEEIEESEAPAEDETAIQEAAPPRDEPKPRKR